MRKPAWQGKPVKIGYRLNPATSAALNTACAQENGTDKMKALPTGTVTFLFTDIVGSTPLWERQPDLMAAALEIHNHVLREAIEAEGGVVFKTVGDAFQTAFPTASQALRAAISGQSALKTADWNELGELKVRMGLHTGEAELDSGGDEYAVSHTKNRVARIMSAAHGGQVLLSQETKELVDHQLPEGVALKDLGEHRLKGMQWLEHLHQVSAPGLQEEFPALSTTISHPNNLPLQLTSFIGREREISEVTALLENHRMVTLTGVGGTGKTRLSLQVAEAVLDDFPNGVWFVELAPLADPDLVQRTLINVLGMQESALQIPLDQLKTYLRQKKLLIALDNCEHVITDCARIAQVLLLACPGLKIMATSREALGITGEFIYHVPSLTIPDLNHNAAVEQLKQNPSIRLFIERAQAAKPDFAITAENANAVAQVCKRLDGIPLAIELAAARVSALSPTQIAANLDNRFRLLTGGSRTALPRQQTLRASIDWSFSLLEETERLLLRRLSVFQGGWTLKQAQQVCGFDGLDDFDVLDGLTSLVNKSLIFTDSGANGENRYHRLETIRQYTQEKLLDSGDSDVLYDRHLDAFLNLAQEAEPHFRSHSHLEWLDRLEVELDNLRSALIWALEQNTVKGFQLLVSSFWFWYCRGHLGYLESTLRQVQVRAKETGVEVDQALLAETHARQAFVMYVTNAGDPLAYQIADEAVRLAKGLGAEHKRIYVLALLAKSWNAPTYRLVTQFSRQCLAMAEEIGDRFLIAESLIALINTEPDLVQVKELLDRRLMLVKKIGDEDGEMSTYMHLGDYYLNKGETTLAFELAEKQIQIAQKLRNTAFGVLGLMQQGHIFLEQGQIERGIQVLTQALEENESLGAPYIFRPNIMMGYAFGLKRDWSKAEGYLQHVIEIARESQIEFWETYAFLSLGEIAHWLGKGVSAAEYYQRVDDLSQLHHSTGLSAYAAGMVSLLGGDLASAKEKFLTALKDYIESMFFPGIGECLEALTLCTIREDCFEKAVKLHGTAILLRDWRQFNNIQPVLIWIMVKEVLKPVRAALGEYRFAELLQGGQAVSVEEAAMYVQAVLDA